VLSAIHHAQLTLEDLHIATLFLEANALFSSSSSTTGNAMLEMQMGRVKKVSCALCGKVVWALPTDEGVPPEHEAADKWNAPKFLKNVVAAGGATLVGTGISQTRGSSHKRAMVRPVSPPPPTSLQTVIPIFRVATSSSSINLDASNLHVPAAPGAPTTSMHQQRSAPYPLCANGWCRERLRTTVELWKFLRERVIERIWEDETRSEMITAHQLGQEQQNDLGVPIPPLKVNTSNAVGSTPLPVPPRKKLAELWGAISGAASPANSSSPTAPSDTAPGTGVASRIGGLTNGLGGFLGRKNSLPNFKSGPSLESSPSPGPPALPPRNARGASPIIGVEVPKVQDTDSEKEKQALVVPAEGSQGNPENVEQKVLAEAEKPTQVQPPSEGSAPLTRNTSDRTHILSLGDFSTPSESVVPAAGALAERLDIATAEPKTDLRSESAFNIQRYILSVCSCAHWLAF
jgi:hypothetical protein